MIMHQKVPDEFDMMIFLFDAEFHISKSPQNSELVDIMVERALDNQIYEKYINLSRL